MPAAERKSTGWAPELHWARAGFGTVPHPIRVSREYHERALATADESMKTDLIKLENAWLELAKQFETLKSMEDFRLDIAKQMGA